MVENTEYEANRDRAKPFWRGCNLSGLVFAMLMSGLILASFPWVIYAAYLTCVFLWQMIGFLGMCSVIMFLLGVGIVCYDYNTRAEPSKS